MSAFLDMIEIVVDRSDDKGEVLLAQDTTPNYTDTAPFGAEIVLKKDKKVLVCRLATAF